MQLSDSVVHEIFMTCLFKEGEDPSGAVLIGGVTMLFGMHPGRLAKNKEKIRELLLELPDQFMESKGGGWSFLNACIDKHDRQWAGHRTIQELFVLGEAVELALLLTPREMWPALPGGMPYYVIIDKSTKPNQVRPGEPFKCACGRLNCELVPSLHRASACKPVVLEEKEPEPAGEQDGYRTSTADTKTGE